MVVSDAAVLITSGPSLINNYEQSTVVDCVGILHEDEDQELYTLQFPINLSKPILDELRLAQEDLPMTCKSPEDWLFDEKQKRCQDLQVLSSHNVNSNGSHYLHKQRSEHAEKALIP